MARHKDKGTIKIGNVTVQEPGKGFTAVRDTGSNNKKTKKYFFFDDSDTKKGKQTFKSKFLYGGSKGVDESIKKESYDDERKHKLRNQFDYLVDKYYGGTKEGAEEFAKTSQGQVLLGYLQNVDARRGGGRGGDMVVYDKIKEAYDAGEISEEDYKKIKQAVGGNTEAIRNLPIDVLRNQPELNRTGIFSSPEYFRFNQLLQSQSPLAYNTARPFSSGALPKTIFDLLTRPVTTIGSGIMDSLDNLGVINRTEKYEPMGLGSYDFLPQSLFENLPTQTTTDQGGMNDVAQFMIDNQTPELTYEQLLQQYGRPNLIPENLLALVEQPEIAGIPDGGITTVFDPDSFLAGFEMA